MLSGLADIRPYNKQAAEQYMILVALAQSAVHRFRSAQIGVDDGRRWTAAAVVVVVVWDKCALKCWIGEQEATHKEERKRKTSKMDEKIKDKIVN